MRRGDVYRFKIPKGTGHEQQGERCGAVDIQRLGRRLDRLNIEEMWSVDDALLAVLGLD